MKLIWNLKNLLFLKIWKFKMKHWKLNHKIFHKQALLRKSLTPPEVCLEWKVEFKCPKIRIKKSILNSSNFLKYNYKVKCKRNKYCNKAKAKMTFWIWIHQVHLNLNLKLLQIQIWKIILEDNLNIKVLTLRKLNIRYVT